MSEATRSPRSPNRNYQVSEVDSLYDYAAAALREEEDKAARQHTLIDD